jgi:hypothetical protein
MRLRATRVAVTINGQGSRHGKEITRNAVSGFLFGDFFKSEKGTRGGDGIPALSSVARCGGDGWMQGCAPCTAVVFLYAQKVTKDAHERGISISPSHDFSLEATQEGRPRPSWITPRGRETETRDARDSALRADLLSFRAERGIPHSEAYAIVDGDSSALDAPQNDMVFIHFASRASQRQQITQV